MGAHSNANLAIGARRDAFFDGEREQITSPALCWLYGKRERLRE
jgi:hypothetical protein